MNVSLKMLDVSTYVTYFSHHELLFNILSEKKNTIKTPHIYILLNVFIF